MNKNKKITKINFIKEGQAIITTLCMSSRTALSIVKWRVSEVEWNPTCTSIYM